MIKIYTGETIEDKCRSQVHPLTEVKRAIKLINDTDSVTTYSNSPDFIHAIKHYGELKNRTIEFFLNGVSTGNDIEPIFEDFNKSFELIDNVCI